MTASRHNKTMKMAAKLPSLGKEGRSLRSWNARNACMGGLRQAKFCYDEARTTPPSGHPSPQLADLRPRPRRGTMIPVDMVKIFLGER